jgi:hypothetical protein
MRKLVLLLIAILICSLAFGCAAPTTPVPAQQPPVSPPSPAPPKVFEKTITEEAKNIAEIQEQILEFYATIGNLVIGEVAVSKTDAVIYAEVRDPYGSAVVRSAREPFLIRGWGDKPATGVGEFTSQKYPWHFAFIAATTGNYTLEANSLDTFPVHLKVSVYEK